MHNQIQKNDSVIPKNYKIENLKGFILDCSQYDLSLIKKLNKGMDTGCILVNSQTGTFLVKLNTKGSTIVDSASMIPFNQLPQMFTGFIKGETARLGIGIMNVNTGGHNEMSAFWSTKIEIK